MPITFDEVTAEVTGESELPAAPNVDDAQHQPEVKQDEDLRRFYRLLAQRGARLWAD